MKTLLGREAFEGAAGLTGENVLPKALAAAEARADDAAANLASHQPLPTVERPGTAPVDHPAPASTERPGAPNSAADHSPTTSKPDPQPMDPPLAPSVDEIPYEPPPSISGMTEHGAEQVLTRDGHGVSDDALRRAVEQPTQPPKFTPDKYGGTYRYVGDDAIVVLNKDGQVVTAWATGRGGWRSP